VKRLTDEELVDLDRWAADDLRGDEQQEVWSAVDELRERRAADLTAEEREALSYARDLVDNDANEEDRRALSVLNRLLGGKP
jgi:DNA-directed RNA polymerase subunit F